MPGPHVGTKWNKYSSHDFTKRAPRPGQVPPKGFYSEGGDNEVHGQPDADAAGRDVNHRAP